MPSYYDDEWEYNDFGYEESEDDNTDEICDFCDYDDYCDENGITDNSTFSFEGFESTVRPPPIWKLVEIEGEKYLVSDHGCIRKPDTLFEVHYGIEEVGTPFRTVTFPTGVTYYMHDIVWQAFNGDPPRGWEVRHTFAETQKRRRYYSNALRHLTIMPIHVTLRPRIFI